MVIFSEAASRLKSFLQPTQLKAGTRRMMPRMTLGFIMHWGRMSCSAAAGSVASEAVHRGEVSRFLARPRWRKQDVNHALMRLLLAKESRQGRFLLIVDATLVSQAGKKTQNTYSTGNRGRNPAQGRRYNNKKKVVVVCKRVHRFTFGLLITPSGIRIPMQIPHHTEEYCRQRHLTHRTTAEAAAHMIRTLPLPDGADVVVLGDTRPPASTSSIGGCRRVAWGRK